MWPNPQFLADLVIFTEEFFNGKLHVLCSVDTSQMICESDQLTGIYFIGTLLLNNSIHVREQYCNEFMCCTQNC